MGIHLQDGRLTLEGQITVEDAECLLQALQAEPAPRVDAGPCEHLHAAALQVLLALRPTLAGAPRDPWLAAALAGLPQAEAVQP